MTSKVTVMTDEGFTIGTDTSRGSAPLVIKSYFFLHRANILPIVTKIKMNVQRYMYKNDSTLDSLPRLNHSFG